MRRLSPLLPMFGLIAAALLSSCAPRQRERPWSPDEAPIDALEEAALVNRIAVQSEETRSFRALFKTTARRGGDIQSFRQAIVFEKPDSLRVEALPPQGALALHLLVSAGGTVTVVIPSEKRAVRGTSSTALFRQHLDLPFREGELIALVSGRVERSTFEAKRELRCGATVCTARRLDGRYMWRFERSSGRLLSLSIRDPLKLTERVRLRYAGHEAFDGIVLPTHIVLELPQDGVEIDMQATVVKANQPIAHTLFEIAIPNDYEVSH